MNITSHTANLPLATVVNPPTEGLRRDNNQREIIAPITATNPSAAEKGVASDKDRARTPAQANEEIDFANLRKQAEYADSAISDQDNSQNDQQNSNKSSNDNSEEQQANANNGQSENSSDSSTDEDIQKEQADEKVINQLQQRDSEVRTHELAHASAGGALTGAPSYSFEVGPDGKKYAVEGEVSVDLSIVEGDPQATIAKLQQAQAAALAPAQPSAQDIRVAASAAQSILTAQSELLALNNDEANEVDSVSDEQTIQTGSTVNSDEKGANSNDFDSLIDQTLLAQEAIGSSPTNQSKSPLSANNSQSSEVLQRAQRIEDYYLTVSQGYEKPNNYQFELTV